MQVRPVSPEQIPSWLGDVTVAEIVVVAVILLGLGRLGKRAWDVLNRVDQTRADLLGEPARPGVDRRKGVVERLHDHDELLREIKHELVPNSGSSLRDAVDRIEAAQRDYARRQDDQHAANVARLDALEESRREGQEREQAYLASLRELGLDIEIHKPEDGS